MSAVWMVVESRLDAILIDQYSDDDLTVLAATSATQKPNKSVDTFLTNKPGLISLDRDEAGENGSQWLKERYTRSERYLSKEKDPGEDFKSGIDIKAWLSAGISKLSPVLPDLVEQKGPVKLSIKDRIDKEYQDKKISLEENIVKFKPKQKTRKPRIHRSTPPPGSILDNIDPQDFCLHNMPCIAFVRQGKQCSKQKQGIFNIEKCPLGKWAIVDMGDDSKLMIF